MFKYSVAVAALVAVSSPAFAAGLVNGSFEQPGVPNGGYTQYGVGGDIGGWAVSGDSTNATLQLHTNYVEPSVAFTAQDGLVALDLTGAGNTGANRVTQSVALAAGNYTLSFFVGNVGGGNEGNQIYYTLPAAIELFINNVSAGIFSNADGAAGVTNWKAFSYSFAANGNTSIAFANATPGGDNYAGLDNVTLTAVPEPATWMTLIFGFGLVGSLARRARRRVAFA